MKPIIPDNIKFVSNRDMAESIIEALNFRLVHGKVARYLFYRAQHGDAVARAADEFQKVGWKTRVEKSLVNSEVSYLVVWCE